MAEFILKSMTVSQGISGQFQIASAATSTEEIWNGIGNPVYPPARAELAKHGISCEGKRAVQLLRQDYEKYDYLIGMDRANIRSIERITGHRGGKIHMMMEFAGSSGEVADPWYTGRFDETYRNIEDGCRGFLRYLSENGEIERYGGEK